MYKDYKKTYKPFIAWLVLFTLITMSTSLFKSLAKKQVVAIILFLTVVSLYLLMLMIYKGEYVYWITGGPSYEEAKAAGSEKRKKFAGSHLKIFTKISFFSIIYILVSSLLDLPIYLDIIVVTMAIIIGAFRTIGIKFDK